MFPITHVLLPLLLVKLYGRVTDTAVTERELLFVAVAGVLPDLFNLHIALAERASFSHSLLILVPLLLAVVVADGRFRRHMGLLCVGVGAHIVLDIASNPYNFLYPVSFEPSYPVWSQCGMGTFICWYAIDLVLVIAFLGVVYSETIRDVFKTWLR